MKKVTKEDILYLSLAFMYIAGVFLFGMGFALAIYSESMDYDVVYDYVWYMVSGAVILATSVIIIIIKAIKHKKEKKTNE